MTNRQTQRLTIPPGTYTFSLKAGETNEHWIMFPEGRNNNIDMSSADNQFEKFFPDGSTAQAWKNVTLPRVSRLKFKVRAVAEQKTIKLEVY